MNRIFAGALKEILGAIKRVKNPEPFGRQGLSSRELLLGRLLTEQGPIGIWERGTETIQQPLIHRQVSGRHWPLTTVVNTQSTGKTVGRLLTAGIGSQDVGSSPAKRAECLEQAVLTDAGRQVHRSRHHGNDLGGAIVKQRAEPEGGVLYLVGTPIGHLGDLSPRARALLVAVDTIACEDTRHSGQLLTALGSTARRCSFHQHNTHGRIPQLLEELTSGHSVAVISDAGLPGISDPGEDLVAAARKAGHAVICIPGPCAATTALVSSGLPSGRFCFEGFLPAKGRERRDRLTAVVAEQRTTVLYEAPHRLMKLLEELHELCGAERALQVTRELTKRHEEQVGPTVIAAVEHFQKHPPKVNSPWFSAVRLNRSPSA